MARDVRFADVRDHVLEKLGRMTPDQLRGPHGPYSSDALLRDIATRLPTDEYDYIQKSNRLTRSALEASIDRALEERRRYVLGGPRRGRRRRA